MTAVKSGSDRWLATVFMNRHSYSEGELRYLPYHLRREYLLYLLELPDWWEPVTIYATDDEMAHRFAAAQYAGGYTLSEVTRHYRTVPALATS